MPQRSAPAHSARRLCLAALALAVGPLGAMVACTSAGSQPPRRTESVSSGAIGTALRSRLARGTDDRRRSSLAELSPEVRRMRSEDVRRALADAGDGTYIGELLLDRDSALTRWPDRVNRPLTVWIGTSDGEIGWNEAYRTQVRGAFEAWERTGIPMRFAFVDDSAAADVHVEWISRFREPISGKTVWTRDDAWWIVDADITLALHHRDGAPLDTAQMKAIALHEIGHLLGLDHTMDAANVMAPRVRVRELSVADQATARLLYSLPAGKVK